jgi:predicted GIY-YIG superfamily endonuclease
VTDDPGQIYLIHFERSYHHARHYLGWTGNVSARLVRHRNGQGSPLLRVVTSAGIEWELVRLWQGDRSIERKLKKRKRSSGLCPVCLGVPLAADVLELVQTLRGAA